MSVIILPIWFGIWTLISPKIFELQFPISPEIQIQISPPISFRIWTPISFPISFEFCPKFVANFLSIFLQFAPNFSPISHQFCSNFFQISLQNLGPIFRRRSSQSRPIWAKIQPPILAIPLPIFQFWSIRKFSEFDPMIKLWFKLTAAHPNWFFGRPISKFGLSRGKFCPRLAVGEISNFGHPISKLLPLLLLGWSQMRNFQIYQIWMAIFQIWSTTMSVLFGLFHFDAPIPKNWAEHTKLTVQSPKSNGISFKFGVNWSEMFQIGREMGKKLEIDHPIPKIE